MRNPSDYLRAIQERRKREHYQAWKNEWSFDEFVKKTEEHLVPFLKSRGYVMGVAPLVFARRWYEWAWVHQYVYDFHKSWDSISTGEPCHHGTDDDYAWFGIYCPEEDWTVLMNRIQEDNILDGSPVGYRQRMGFPSFVWLHVALESSPSYQKTQEIRENYTDEEEGEHLPQDHDEV